VFASDPFRRAHCANRPFGGPAVFQRQSVLKVLHGNTQVR